MRRQFTPTSTLGVALGAVSLIVAGCGAAVHGGAAAVPLKSTVQGVAIYGPLARPVRWTRTRWSPAGTHFAFAVDPRQGIAEVGSTNPLRGEQVALGLGRSVVALTAHDAIVASWSRRHDWLYPVQGTSLGTPVPWTGATDCWQQWVETAQGPAIVTGGYRSGTLALAWANGHTLALAGSQVCVAPSGRVGAVVGGGHCYPAVVHPVGNQQVPSLHQPSSATAPIRLWQFDAVPPRVLATVYLPRLHLPKAAGSVSVERIVFSPNGRYVAIWVMGDYGVGAQQQMVGATFIYAVASGHLMGQAPVGNGIEWAANSQFLWIGTPDPQGQGADRVVKDGVDLARHHDSVGHRCGVGHHTSGDARPVAERAAGGLAARTGAGESPRHPPGPPGRGGEHVPQWPGRDCRHGRRGGVRHVEPGWALGRRRSSESSPARRVQRLRAGELT